MLGSMDEIETTWGGWFRSRISHLGKTQKDLGSSTGSGSTRVNNWCKATDMPAFRGENREAVARELQVEEAELPYVHFFQDPARDGFLDRSTRVAPGWLDDGPPRHGGKPVKRTESTLNECMTTAAHRFYADAALLLNGLRSTEDLPWRARAEAMAARPIARNNPDVEADNLKIVDDTARIVLEQYELSHWLEQIGPPEVLPEGCTAEDLTPDRIRERIDAAMQDLAYRQFVEVRRLRLEAFYGRISGPEYRLQIAVILGNQEHERKAAKVKPPRPPKRAPED